MTQESVGGVLTKHSDMKSSSGSELMCVTDTKSSSGEKSVPEYPKNEINWDNELEVSDSDDDRISESLKRKHPV